MKQELLLVLIITAQFFFLCILALSNLDQKQTIRYLKVSLDKIKGGKG